MTLPIKLLTQTAKLPSRANSSDAGLDLYADIQATLHLMPGDWLLIPTGVAIAMYPWECGQIWPRSGLAVKFGIDVLAGLIDPGYRGEIKVCLINKGMDCYHFEPGDKIAQLVIVPFIGHNPEMVDELTSGDRGDKGFGSSGQ